MSAGGATSWEGLSVSQSHIAESASVIVPSKPFLIRFLVATSVTSAIDFSAPIKGDSGVSAI